MFRLRSVLRNADAGAAGGGTPAAAAPAETPAAESAKPASKDERKGAAVALIRANMDARKGAPAAAPAPAPATEKTNAATIEAAPTEAAAESAEKLAEAGKKVPEQKEGESDKKYELRLAKALQDLRELEAVGKREKAGRESAEKKVAELERRLARAKDPETALEALEDLFGHTYESLTKGLIEKKIKPRGSAPSLPPELAKQLEAQQAELAALKRAEEERAKEQQTKAQAARFEEHTTQTKAYLEENAEEYPLLAAASWAPGDIVRTAYSRNTGDIATIARELEDAIATNILSLVNDNRALKALTKRDPKVRDKIVEVLGLAATKAAEQSAKETPAAKPAAKPASKISTEAATPRTTPLSKTERHALAVAQLREKKRAG